MLEFEHVISNGYVDIETIEAYANKGYKFIATVPAILAQPHAWPNDKLSIFSKYTEPSIDDNACANITE